VHVELANQKNKNTRPGDQEYFDQILLASCFVSRELLVVVLLTSSRLLKNAA
jgi:hypothetical protein